jgi:hypothetical protein
LYPSIPKVIIISPNFAVEGDTVFVSAVQYTEDAVDCCGIVSFLGEIVFNEFERRRRIGKIRI